MFKVKILKGTEISLKKMSNSGNILTKNCMTKSSIFMLEYIMILISKLTANIDYLNYERYHMT